MVFCHTEVHKVIPFLQEPLKTGINLKYHLANLQSILIINLCRNLTLKSFFSGKEKLDAGLNAVKCNLTELVLLSMLSPRVGGGGGGGRPRGI